MVAIALALVASVGFYLATLLVDTTIGTSRTFHHVSVVIAAGILLGVTFADLIPEAFELLGGVQASFAIAAGFLILFLVEALTGGHTHHHEPHVHDAEGHIPAHAHAHSHAPVDPSDEDCVPRHAVLPFLIGLGIHNFADGLVIGASHESSDAASTAVAVGILVHQLPVGLSFAAVLLASGIARRQVHRDAALTAAIIPLGALVVVLAPNLTDGSLGALVGVAAGALLYIAAGHLLPEAHSEHRRPGIAVAFAVSLLATVAFVGTLHEAAHGHGDDEPAGEHEDEHEDEHADGDDHA